MTVWITFNVLPAVARMVGGRFNFILLPFSIRQNHKNEHETFLRHKIIISNQCVARTNCCSRPVGLSPRQKWWWLNVRCGTRLAVFDGSIPNLIVLSLFGCFGCCCISNYAATAAGCCNSIELWPIFSMANTFCQCSPQAPVLRVSERCQTKHSRERRYKENASKNKIENPEMGM